MQKSIASLCLMLPTYGRPHTLQRVATNIEEATKTPFKLYFGVEADDKESAKAAKATGHEVVINKYAPGYSNTIQSIYEQTEEPFMLHCNDDFHFLEGWEMPSLKMLKDDMDAMVIGISDGNPQTNYWTICMIRRSYIEDRSGVVDMPNRVFFPYNHNFQDTEFTATAIARGVWRKSEGKAIEHHHPGLAQWFGPVEYDMTYHKNDDTVALDHRTYLARKHLWESPSA